MSEASLNVLSKTEKNILSDLKDFTAEFLKEKYNIDEVKGFLKQEVINLPGSNIGYF